jgi:hypothetical protein
MILLRKAIEISSPISMEALRKKSGNRPRWHDTKTGFENLLKNYKKRLDELRVHDKKGGY